jgi:hypothetical protein
VAQQQGREAYAQALKNFEQALPYPARRVALIVSITIEAA